MTRSLPALTGVALTIACGSAARAQPDFGYVYTAETEERGETEVSLWATHRAGKAEGHYDTQDYRIEVEHGVTERLQVSGYANLVDHHVGGLCGDVQPIERNLGFQGLSAEFKYQLRAPEKGRLGIAVYAEPEWSRIGKITGRHGTEYGLELKAIVQKSFLHDRLAWAANLTFEPESEREHEEFAPVVRETEQELAVEVSTGVTYQLAPRLWVGAEGRYHSVYPDWTHGLHRENYAVHAGPSVHYDGGKWGLTATWLPQLFGGPSAAGSSLELEDHEKNELRVKLSYEF